MAPQAQHKPIYTKDKASHLIRVYCAILSVFFLIGWMQMTLLRPLRDEKKEMAHMDPSEILAIPYSLKTLNVFVMFPVVIIMILWLITDPTKMMSNLLSLTKLTMATYALFGFCGSHIVNDWQHSLTAALYIGALASTTSTGKRTSNILEELPFYDHSDLLAANRFYGMLLVSIPFQVLTVLDRGIQIQRWPLPIILGGTYGYAIGTMSGLFLLHFQKKGEQRTR